MANRYTKTFDSIASGLAPTSKDDGKSPAVSPKAAAECVSAVGNLTGELLNSVGTHTTWPQATGRDGTNDVVIRYAAACWIKTAMLLLLDWGPTSPGDTDRTVNGPNAYRLLRWLVRPSTTDAGKTQRIIDAFRNTTPSSDPIGTAILDIAGTWLVLDDQDRHYSAGLAIAAMSRMTDDMDGDELMDADRLTDAMCETILRTLPGAKGSGPHPDD